MSELICRRFLISGRVQGVFFRATTAEEARQHGIRGWAKNLRDGRVEVLAVGEAGRIAAFGQWLWSGSPMSNVENVQEEALPMNDELAELNSFRTG